MVCGHEGPLGGRTQTLENLALRRVVALNRHSPPSHKSFSVVGGTGNQLRRGGAPFEFGCGRRMSVIKAGDRPAHGRHAMPNRVSMEKRRSEDLFIVVRAKQMIHLVTHAKCVGAEMHLVTPPGIIIVNDAGGRTIV